MDPLPPEIFLRVLENLDFKTIHTSCVLVSRFWYNTIIYHKKISSDMVAIAKKNLDKETFTTYLKKRWPVLSSLYVGEKHHLIENIDFEKLPNLRIVNMEARVQNPLRFRKYSDSWCISVRRMNHSPNEAVALHNRFMNKCIMQESFDDREFDEKKYNDVTHITIALKSSSVNKFEDSLDRFESLENIELYIINFYYDEGIFTENLNEIVKYLTKSGYNLYVRKLTFNLPKDISQVHYLNKDFTNIEKITIWLSRCPTISKDIISWMKSFNQSKIVEFNLEEADISTLTETTFADLNRKKVAFYWATGTFDCEKKFHNCLKALSSFKRIQNMHINLENIPQEEAILSSAYLFIKKWFPFNTTIVINGSKENCLKTTNDLSDLSLNIESTLTSQLME